MQFHGKRRFPTSLVHFESLQPRLFICRNNLAEMSWIGEDIDAHDWVPPSRDQLEPFKHRLNERFEIATQQDMKELFVGWPNNIVEEWAVDYNPEFRLKFDIFYDIALAAATMETVLHIACHGICSIDWYDYLDAYLQAQTMYKLKEGI